jgi:hypothetical protein
MMTSTRRDPPIPASLDRRIRQAEQRLADRQRSTGVHAAALGRTLRGALSSPVTLLIAAGAGFALGQFSKRRGARACPDGDPPRAGRSIFATLMEAITLASTVMAILPARRREPARQTGPAREAL